MRCHLKMRVALWLAIVALACCYATVVCADDTMQAKVDAFSKAHPLNTIYIDASGQRCKEFVSDFYQAVFAIEVPAYTASKNALNPSVSLQMLAQLIYQPGVKFTADQVRDCLLDVPQYAIIQMFIQRVTDKITYTTQHTAMIISEDDTSFTMYDANWVLQFDALGTPTANRNLIKNHSFTYETFAEYINFQGGGFTVYYPTSGNSAGITESLRPSVSGPIPVPTPIRMTGDSLSLDMTHDLFSKTMSEIIQLLGSNYTTDECGIYYNDGLYLGFDDVSASSKPRYMELITPGFQIGSAQLGSTVRQIELLWKQRLIADEGEEDEYASAWYCQVNGMLAYITTDGKGKDSPANYISFSLVD